MFHFFERQRLVKKGLASAKCRRRRTRSELRNTLETGLWVKAGILALFCLGLALLILSGTQPQPVKNLLVGLLIFATALTQLWINHPNSFASNSRLALIYGTILANLAVSKGIMALAHNGGLSSEFGPLIIPYALAPLVCSVLLGKNQGLYAAVFTSLWGSIVYHDVEAIYLVMGLICGFTAVFVTLSVRKRSRLVRAGFYVGLATWLLALAFGRIEVRWDLFPAIDWTTLGWQSLAAI